MAKNVKFKRSTFDPTIGAGSALYGAAAIQVMANWKQEQLNSEHASGSISDEEYVKGLKTLTQDYRKGTGLQQGLRSATVGAAQQVASGYQAEREQAAVAFADEALSTFNKATSDYAAGLINEAEYTQQRDLYNQAIKGTAPVPQMGKVTKQVLKGKFWDQYKSGRVRNLMREKQIKGLYKDVYGNKISKPELKTLAGGEGTLGYIKQQLITDKGVARDLAKEQAALSELIKTLGRLPTTKEINDYVYGS